MPVLLIVSFHSNQNTNQDSEEGAPVGPSIAMGAIATDGSWGKESPFSLGMSPL